MWTARIKHELILTGLGNSYKETQQRISDIFSIIKEKYPNMKKGIFMQMILMPTFS